MDSKIMDIVRNLSPQDVATLVAIAQGMKLSELNAAVMQAALTADPKSAQA